GRRVCAENERVATTARKRGRTAPNAESGAAASKLIDARIEALGDWRGATLAHVRALIREVDPDVVEEWKWRGVPVWSHDGIICTGETYKDVVKPTFTRGAASTIRRACSMRASTATHGGLSICAKATRSTRKHSRRWFARRWR